ncbi:MMPL family transporter [Kitasatospora sp. NPDC004289]
MLTLTGRWCVRRPGTVLTGWLLLITTALAAVTLLGSATSETVTIPGSDSQAAHDLAARSFPEAPSGSQPVVLHVPPDRPPLGSGPSAEAVRAAARAMALVPHVLDVGLPYGDEGRARMSADGRTAYLTVELDVSARGLTPELTRSLLAAAAPAEAAGIEVTPGGGLAAAADKGSTHRSELVGMAAALVVLALAFRRPAAAVLPLLTGLAGLAVSLSLLGLVGHVVDVPSAGTTIAAMIGLGVGIDYTLFSLTRFRELRGAGVEVGPAALATTTGSGRAVAFAGCAVVAALAGLALGGLPLLYALALAPALAVLTAVAVNLTLLPALLVLLGPWLSAKRPPVGAGDRRRTRGWRRIAELVTARPWRPLLAGLALMALLAAPALQLTFGQLDGSHHAPGTMSRTAHDRLAAAFGPGAEAALLVTATLPAPASASDSVSVSAMGPAEPGLAAVTEALRRTPGVAAVAGPAVAPGGRDVRWKVTPTSAAADPATAGLVHRLRAGTLPSVTAGTGWVTHVGGVPAAQADLNQRIADRLPRVAGFVLATAALLLLLAFRAPVVAVKAVLLNLVSVGAAYGVLTAVFPWGWGRALTGLDAAVPVPGYVPLLMFAVLFGLSMDYEVFLLTAVREAHLQGLDDRAAVVQGLTRTAGVITSAALIMVSVFLGYLLSGDPVVKMFGIGLATAVALDATVVRGLLVPTSMVLLGRANWWLPARLGRLLPRIAVEGRQHAQPDVHGT